MRLGVSLRATGALSVLALALAGCAATVPAPQIVTDNVVSTDDAIDARVAELLAGMSIERKVAQLIMPDISTITPADMEQYRFGMYLNGGNSGPGGDDHAPAPEWLALADAMWVASMQPMADGGPVIPTLWATDAVHGHANIPGATIFPHNIGLGATRDVDLMRRIGAASAAEIAVTGIDWTFAPTLAVVTDTRWGRTYESYSADPGLVGELGAAMVEGLQGEFGTEQFLDETRVIATVKHWFGDGGTGGLDQGDTRGDLDDLVAMHAAPYGPSFEAGAQSVMASFSSINGVKMHGNGPLLDGLLRDEMGFAGITVGDWNGHGQVPGCTDTDCAAALMAGLDVFMVPENWRGLYDTLVAQVRDGTIPMARLDEAVARMLRLKLTYGLFDKPRPSERELGGEWSVIGSPEHRDIAREAVRESLVLLENDGVLPLAGNARVLVTGGAADDVAQQAGGWTVTWQGGAEVTEADLVGSTSIYDGMAQALSAHGGEAVYSADGSYSERPDVAVVVFGEEAYAEFVGDRDDHILEGDPGLELLRRYRAEGIPTVAVLVAGRPLWMNREIAEADAFVMAWLPGSEGQGVADVLVGDAAGAPRHDFSGRLPFAWPAGCSAGSGDLLPLGAGLTYGSAPLALAASTECAELSRGAGEQLSLFDRSLARGVTATAQVGDSAVVLPGLRGTNAGIDVRGYDLAAQEDARMIDFAAPGRVVFDLAEAGTLPANAAIDLVYLNNAQPVGNVFLQAGTGAVDLTSTLSLAVGKGERTARIPLSCLTDGPVSQISLAADGAASIVIASLSLVSHPGAIDCTGPF